MRRFTRKDKKVYGTHKDQSDIYKDSIGFYVAAWNPRTLHGYKKYLKGWKPRADTMCFVNKKWRPCKTRKAYKKRRNC